MLIKEINAHHSCCCYMEDTLSLNEVKSLILLKTGIRTITPADCKRISIEISKTLNKNVSETTIKRLFGFAVVKHNFSKFTITTLAEYVRKEDDGEWPHPANSGIQDSSEKWQDIRNTAKKITDFTLKAIRNRSGIPYGMTISRKFAEHDFNDFFKSNQSFTCFISQPGYGKTILLGHLIEKFFINEYAVHKDSTAMFITVGNLFNQDQLSVNFEEQLKIQLGMNQRDSLMEYIQKNYEATGKKFVIFLDGFSELIIKKDLKKQLFENITSFICSIENVECIKLVMSMRSTTWMRFYENIRHSAFLKSKWFPGNYYNQGEISNVPPLTEKEVDLIISKINYSDVEGINPKLKSQLKFPLYIQLYYQLREEDPYFNNSTSITFHELISRFIQEKIYRSNYYTEKILFIKKVIQLTDYGKKECSVPKNLLIAELSAFKNAYMELLSEGILMEDKSMDDYQPREYVRFIYPHIFEYFLFIELLEKFHLQVDKKFFEYIQDTYENNSIRFHLLQWSIRFIIKIGDFKSLSYIFDFQHNYFESHYLILFTAESLRLRSRTNPDTLRSLTEENIHDIFIKQLMNFDFVDSCYKEAVTVLAQITDSDEHKLIYQSILAIADIMSMNPKLISKRLEVLHEINAAYWPVDPRTISLLVYNNLTDAVQPHHQMISDLKNGNYHFLHKEGDFDTKEAIMCLMTMILNMFYDSYEGAIKLIAAIFRLRPDLFHKRSAFTIFLLNVLAYSCSKVHPGKKANQMERVLVTLHNDKARFGLTEYSETIFRMVQASQLRNQGMYLKACEFATECIQTFKRNDLNLNCIMMYDFIIEIFQHLKDQAKVNEYKYEKLCFMEERNIPTKVSV